MSELLPSAVPLTSGLDFTVPKLLSPPGSLVGCLNYELVDFSGYKSIDGYERYDAQPSPSLTEVYVLRTADSIAAYSVGDILMGTKLSPYTVIKLASEDITGAFGIVVKKTTSILGGNALYFAKFNDIYLPGEDDTAAHLNLTTGLGEDSILVDSIGVVIDEKQQNWSLAYQEILDAQEILRGYINGLPGQPIGLHWFRDRLHAVCGLTKLYIVPTSDGTTPSTGNKGAVVIPEINQTISASNGASGIVIAATDKGFAPATHDDIFDDLEVVELSIIDLYTGSWEDAFLGAEVNWDASTTTGLVHSKEADAINATLYVSKTINQTIDEDTAPYSFGWKNIHQGWTLNIANGNVAAGYLDKEEVNSNAATTGTTYWFYNGSTKFSATLNSYFLVSGTFTGGTAVAELQIGDLTRISGTANFITSSYDMYSDLACLTKVADVSSTMAYNALKGLQNIINDDSRYEFISANFYATDGFDAFYGVSSSERAFYYNGTFFAKIFTQADATLDHPRHIAVHVGHLALGFLNGSLQLSVVGEPWNYSGIDGASEEGFSSPIRGLASLPGDTLAVFCEDGIKTLVGQTVSDFLQKTIIAHAGFIEYSLADMGRPIYCTNWGISTIEQSQKYGDFVGNRLSKSINPWLTPRLVDKDSGRYGADGVLCAVPIRSKNQYRLFLKSGTIVTMTVLEGQEPGFTIQKYSRVEDSRAYIKPICFSSEIDNFGKERIHFGTWEPETAVPVYRITEDESYRLTQLLEERVINGTVLSGQNGSNYVYEGDVGWSFDGELIPGYFETNWYYGDRPTTNVTCAGIRLYGLILGKASLNAYAAGIENDFNRYFSGRAQPINLDRKVTTKVHQDYRPATNIADLASRGLGTQFLVERSATENEPPHIVQLMIVYSRPGGNPDTP